LENQVQEVKEVVQDTPENAQNGTETKEEEKKGKSNRQQKNAEIDALKAEIEALKTQLAESQAKLQEYEKKQAEYEQKQNKYLATIQRKDVELKLAQKGLSEFQEFFMNVEADKLDEQIEKFQQLLKQKEIENSFKPNDYKKEDAYSVAKKKGDLKSMFSALMFGNNN
jgi:chromosome segregation ATPase